MSRTKRLALTSLLAVALALAGLLFIRNLIDFPVYYAAGRSLLEGRTDLYAADFALGRVMDYRYPPFFLVALTPLWLLPYKVAAYIWYLLSVLQIIGCVLVLRRLVGAASSSKKLWIVAALVTAQYFVMMLHYGNAHLLITFLLFASFYLMIRRRDLLAALLISLAISIKLTPVLTLPYFVLKKKWKLLFLVSLFLIAINLAPAAYFGVSKNAELLTTWYGHVVADQEFHEANGPINLSLKGQLRRYLSEVDYSKRVDGDINYQDINLASLSKEQADLAWQLTAGIVYVSVFALIWWVSYRSKPSEKDRSLPVDDIERGDERVLLEMGLVICATLFVGPLASKIYFTALLWPVVCLGSFAFFNLTSSARLARLALLIVAVTNFVLPLLPGRSLQRLLLVLGVDFYLNALLMASLAWVLARCRRDFRSLCGELRTQARPAARTP